MNIDRRAFLAASFAAVASGRGLAATATDKPARKPIKAILFDAFPLFDPRVVAALAERLYPEKAATLVQAWRSRQFEYQWLRALGDRYVDFLQIADDSLTYAARQSGLTLTSEGRGQLMGAYRNLEVWPDVQDVLPKLRALGISLGILSNMTGGALESGLARANLSSLFSHVLSTDRVKSYKPSRAAYQLGLQSLGLERDQILFVAYAGWDVAGAVWFGYPTYWLNRLGSVPEGLDASPLATGADLHSLLSFLEAQAA
jgi:2-haloacid dehalogenase